MKTLVTVGFLVFYSQSLNAQILIALVFGDKLNTDKLAFGLVVSPTLSNITNTGGELRSGLGLGLYFDIKLSDNFFLHPEATPKSSFGSEGLAPYATGSDTLDALFVNGEVERKVRAISLPLLCRYRIKGLFFAELGPQIDWILKVKDIYETDIMGNEMTYTTSVDEHFSRFDFGLAGGLNLKLKKDKGMGLGIRYFYGLTDIMKSTGMQTNQALYFNISIPVGTGKATENGEN